MAENELDASAHAAKGGHFRTPGSHLIATVLAVVAYLWNIPLSAADEALDCRVSWVGNSFSDAKKQVRAEFLHSHECGPGRHGPYVEPLG